MTKEVLKHRKEEKKKPLLTSKEKKAKKREKKQGKGQMDQQRAVSLHSTGYFHSAEALRATKGAEYAEKMAK